MQTVGQAFESRRNNFDLIRLFAALLVLWSHSYPLTGDAYEPVYALLGGYDTGGGWAVSAFFVISGFLVTRSVLNHSTSAYLAARALRILPALAVVVVLQALVVGPIFTSRSVTDYFRSPTVWAHLKASLVFWRAGVLPGVFDQNPIHGINGSLWTLPIEVSFYLLLPILALLGMLRRGPILAVLAAAAIGYGVEVSFMGLDWGNQGGRLFGIPLYSATKNGLLFLLGATLWAFRDCIPLNGWLALVCVVAMAISANGWAKTYAFFIALPYLTIYAALARPIRVSAYEQLGDISYGSYLFAFPVQQMLVAILGASMGATKLTILAVPITLSLALLSWCFVERPMLRLREKLIRRSTRPGGKVSALAA